ncbi:MAG: hypothetical protein FJX54_04040 [Alphaproteobacteria bacterium]|nr:hypothetical protein [Alphaproteobacteria bacterium]
MSKLALGAILVAATALGGCVTDPSYRSGPSYGYVHNGTFYADRSPYNGEFWDRYYYGPRYY